MSSKPQKTMAYPPGRNSKYIQEDLTEARIITKNLVYVIGLSSSIANKDKLIRYEYFGQYGTIKKIVVNKNKAYNQNSPNGPSFSAYVTFSKPSEASIAILSLDETTIDNHNIRASFGTTKYCSYFLKGVECTNKDCVFLHKQADENDIIKRGDLNSNKTFFEKQHKYAIRIADIDNPEVKKKIMKEKESKKHTVFPPPWKIYKSGIINEEEITSDEKGKVETSGSSSDNSETGSHKLFLSRDSSRYGFCDSGVYNYSGIDVPVCVQKLISKRLSLLKLCKYMKKGIDEVLEREIFSEDPSRSSTIENNSEQWVDFIKAYSNGEKFYTLCIDEYTTDFDNISNFITESRAKDINDEPI